MLRNNADARRCSYFELGLPVGVWAIASIITLTDETDKCTKKPADAPIRGRTNDLVV